MRMFAQQLNEGMWLEEITDPNAPVRAFYLWPTPKKYRAGSTLLVFTPEGIALMGDVTPGHFGSVSAIGYSLEWFAQLRSSDVDYLAAKFLTRSWQPSLAADWVAQELRDASVAQAEHGALLKDIETSLRANEMPQHEFIENLEEMGYTDGYEIGHGYDPEEVATLVCIQRHFSMLYPRQPRP